MPSSVMNQVCCRTPTRTINLAWIHLQQDGSISVGLNDKTFIAPKFKARHLVWSLYNRSRMRMAVTTDADATERVDNPHFTFHPRAWFHLKGNAGGDETLFEGLADVELTLGQQPTLPWVLAFSAPLAQLRSASQRQGKPADQVLMIQTPDEEISAFLAVDFVRKRNTVGQIDASTWIFEWGATTIQVRVGIALPHRATLSWFYEH